ncbi:helix-turn-helix domain-containing protein [Planotetraspora phitsanulokensis]|uniref:Transcriptional regulator n=1 Tax=Planotetraspora phitsanulokensis TaxID=575192 RepID=A0A8J3TZM7_9ACTN|nr:helix-turn-helix domain-containing protein [Planotetraspora phitsanulokensis]GII35192.1 transcriptional regulator [Planotetraspora phitsanulokensis]
MHVESLELLAHPVRLRIVHAMRGGRELTTAQLCARIPDASKAMVYRHVDVLTAGGILEVAGERRVRGAVERRYRLRLDRIVVDADAVAALSPDDHRRVFATSMAVLAAEFNAYLDRENSDPAADLVGYRQHAVWLDRGELEQMIGDLRRVLLPWLSNEPAPDRTQYLLSPIFFPIEQPPAESETD